MDSVHYRTGFPSLFLHFQGSRTAQVYALESLCTDLMGVRSHDTSIRSRLT